MKIVIASDHAGYELKDSIIHLLQKQNIWSCDVGVYNTIPVDYPDFANTACRHLLQEPSPVHFGILICGSGIGMSIAANRYQGIRAAVCNDGPQSAYLARAHNNANVLCLGARLIGKNQALETVSMFINTSFEGGRHINRLKKIDPDYC